MGIPLNPAIANYYMKLFDTKVLDFSTLKQECLFYDVDDIDVIWNYGD